MTTRKTATAKGSQMSYEEGGSADARPLLFLHGCPAWSYVWRNVLPHVEARWRSIAVDLIGMGHSDKPESLSYSYWDHLAHLEAFVDALALKDVTLVMHDWGASLGTSLARRHPEKIRALAIMEPIFLRAPTMTQPKAPRGGMEYFMKMMTYLPQFRDPVKGPELIMEKNVFLDEVLPFLSQRALTPEEHAAYKAPYPTPQSRKAMYAWPNELPLAPGQKQDIVDEHTACAQWLMKSELPKLVVYGSAGIVQPQDIGWFTDTFAKLETAYVGQARHYLQEDQPEAVGLALSDWLRRLPS